MRCLIFRGLLRCYAGTLAASGIHRVIWTTTTVASSSYKAQPAMPSAADSNAHAVRLMRIGAHLLQQQHASAQPGGWSKPPSPLSEGDVRQFLESGYVILPSVMSRGHSQRCREAVEQLERDREPAGQKRPPPQQRFVVSYPELGELCAHPPVLSAVKQLMGRYGNGRQDCGMHHMHCLRSEEGATGAKWQCVQ